MNRLTLPRLVWLIAAGFAFALPSRAGAQAPAPATARGSSAATEAKVVALTGELELDDIIEVTFDQLDAWAATHDPTKLVPYLNGRAILGNYPVALDLRHNRLQFHLQITPANRGVWIDLLGSPQSLRKAVSFSVGPETGSPFPSSLDNDKSPRLTVISSIHGLISLAVIIGTLVLFIWLARTTSIIRDSGPLPPPGKLKPYNLGRTQMAFWFWLTYVSYFAIWLITDDLDTITPALLGLMGISAGTALSEVLIDSNKDAASASKLQDLTAEKQALEQTIPALQAQATAPVSAISSADDALVRNTLNAQLLEKRTRLAQVTQQLNALAPSPAGDASAGFIRDLLSDGDGYSFHRFQIFAWTIVLGIIFVSSVYYNLTMPAFSATLLGLMGMSSGTYIGFKFPEAR